MGTRSLSVAHLAMALVAASACNQTTGPGSLSGGMGGVGGHGATVASSTTGSGQGGSATKSASATGTDPCAGVTCSGKGTCASSNGSATCTCVAGYHAVGLTCVIDEKCGPMTCGNCATCTVKSGVAVCDCPTGYSLQGNACHLTTDPCATTMCGAGKACVSEAHCQPRGACVDTCDCSNCPNCGPNANWSTQQEYCGGGQSGPATKACTKPCAGGQGCLPYNQPICWPLEGCFSL